MNQLYSSNLIINVPTSLKSKVYIDKNDDLILYVSAGVHNIEKKLFSLSISSNCISLAPTNLCIILILF